MWNKWLFWQLFPALLCVLVLSLLAVTWVGTDWRGDFYHRQTARDLEARARLIHDPILELVAAGDFAGVNAFCTRQGKSAATRITVVARDGTVIGESDEDPATMANHGSRPEIRQACGGGVGQSVRYSTTLRQDMLYIAVPLRRGAEILGTIRTAVPLTYTNLEARARMIESEVRHLVASGSAAAVDAFCKARGRAADTGITVVDPSGAVLGDSAEAPARLENQAARPEVKTALGGGVGREVRHNPQLGRIVMYDAVPLMADGRIIGALRVAIPLEDKGSQRTFVYVRIAAAGLAGLALAIVLTLVVTRRIVRPLRELKLGAERFAHGDLETRLPLAESEELGSVAESLNRMAQQLTERIRTIREQSNEVEAVLSSMVEGVLAVDTAETIIRINQAAANMLGVDPAAVEQRIIQEAVRNPALQEVVAGALAAAAIVEREIVIHGPEDKFLQAHGTVLRDSEGRRMGALVVLNDVTRLRRLENLRRDFVANVSHELRTPITSIKGFVETLLDGAINVPENAERFLAIVAKQVNRLNAIMEDLLLISGLEGGREKTLVKEEPGELREVLEGAIQICGTKAAEKRITVECVCAPGLKAAINAPLLEQAIMNLVDNAIKYSEPETRIAVEATAQGGEAVIRVRDRGCGIAEEHLPRIFERFYRIDKARSRKLGGTGLGLAIVKHIAQVHRGRVSVESVSGEGSVFSIHLPLE